MIVREMGNYRGVLNTLASNSGWNVNTQSAQKAVEGELKSITTITLKTDDKTYTTEQVAQDRKSSQQAAALDILKQLIEIRPELERTIELHAAGLKAMESGNPEEVAKISARIAAEPSESDVSSSPPASAEPSSKASSPKAANPQSGTPKDPSPKASSPKASSPQASTPSDPEAD